MENKKYLLFDVETTGLPKKRYASLNDYSNWPNIVQLAWGVYNIDGECLKIRNYIIKPDNFVIPIESTRIHNISQEIAEQKGVDLINVLKEFIEDTESVEYLIAHNLEFDYKVLLCELNRNNMKSNISCLRKICTMQCSTDYCKLGELKHNKYKWPKLSELYYVLFNKHAEGLHDALVDIEICNLCFQELRTKNIICC